MPKLNNKAKAFLIIAGAVVVVASLCTVPGWLGLHGSVRDWLVHEEAETLVRDSENIVIGRYADETIYEVPNTPTAHATSPTSFVDVHRRFEVVETLKGSFEAGDAAHAAWNVGYYKRRQKCQGRRQYVPLRRRNVVPPG